MGIIRSAGITGAAVVSLAVIGLSPAVAAAAPHAVPHDCGSLATADFHGEVATLWRCMDPDTNSVTWHAQETSDHNGTLESGDQIQLHDFYDGSVLESATVPVGVTSWDSPSIDRALDPLQACIEFYIDTTHYDETCTSGNT